MPYTCADCRKAARLLGYKAKVPFEEGIKRTVEWYNGAYGSKSNDLEECPETGVDGFTKSSSAIKLSAMRHEKAL